MLCVTSSEIASLLLPSGHTGSDTAHSTFSIPVETLSNDSFCQIDKNSKQADMLCEVRLIIWDEVSPSGHGVTSQLVQRFIFQGGELLLRREVD